MKYKQVSRPLVGQINKYTGEVIAVYNNFKQAEKSTGVWANRISKVCKGETKSAGGYGWSWVVEIENEGLLYLDADGQITKDKTSAVDTVKPLRFYSIQYKVFVECDDTYLLGTSGTIYKYFKRKGHYRALSKERTMKMGYRTRISYKGQGIKDRLDVYLTGALITTFIDENYDNPIGNNSEYRQGKEPTLFNVRKINK